MNENTQQQEVIEQPVATDHFTITLPKSIAVDGTLYTVWILLALWVYKYVLQPRYDKAIASFSYSLQSEKEMDAVLNRILAKTDADRVMMYMPHNGTVFSNGLHQWKLSCKVEVVEPGLAHIKHHAQNIDINAVISTARYLLESKDTHPYYYVSRDSETQTLDAFIDYLHGQGGVKTSILVGVRGKDPDTFCILDFQYVSDADVDVGQEIADVSDDLKHLASVISHKNPPFIQTLFRDILSRN